MGQRIRQITNDGLTFEVIDSGPLDGTPVVLLHGFPQRAASWAQVSERLHQAGLRTYALDQRGYSPGARPTKVRDYAIDLLAGDVAALADAIGTPVHVVGHDWGATAAWAFAIQHPELTRSLTALSVGHPAAYLKALTGPQGLKSYYMAVFQIPGLAERLLAGRWGRKLLGEGQVNPVAFAQVWSSFERDILADGALVGGLNWYRALPFSLRADRGPVATPTTLVWSTGDAYLGRRQADLTADYVTAPYELIVINDASHWLPDERPDEVAAAIAARVASV